MSNEDITSSVRKLLEGCGISDTTMTETACLQAFRAPQSALFAIQTATLSKFMRILKSKAISEKAKQNIEESFMKLVTKDNGCLPQILGHIARDLRDTSLMEIIAAASISSSASVNPTITAVNNNNYTNNPPSSTSSFTPSSSSSTGTTGPIVQPNNYTPVPSNVSSVTNTPSRPSSSSYPTNTIINNGMMNNGLPPPQQQQQQISVSRKANSTPPTSIPINASLPSNVTTSVIPPSVPMLNTLTNGGSVTGSVTVSSSSSSTAVSSSSSVTSNRLVSPISLTPSIINTNTSQPSTPTRIKQPNTTTLSNENQPQEIINKPLSTVINQGMKDISVPLLSSQGLSRKSSSFTTSTTVPAISIPTQARTTTVKDNTLILSFLQTYAKDTSLPVSVDNFTNIDASILRYGSLIAVRNQGSNLFLSAPLETDTMSTIQSTNYFTNDQDNIFTILHAASHTTSETVMNTNSLPYKGIPVRCGDSILLKSIKTQRYLSLPSSSSSTLPSTNSLFPDRASTDAKDIVLVSTVPTVNERWTIIAPTGLCLAIKVYENSWSSELSRPYICANSNIVLLSHGYGSNTVNEDTDNSTNNSIDVVSSALAAMSRLQILLSDSITQRTTTVFNPSKGMNNRQVLSGTVVSTTKPYVDIASSVIYTDSMGKGPLSSTVLAHTLCTSLLPETLWSIVPLPPHYHYSVVNKSSATDKNNNNYTPLNWFNDSVTCIPSLTGTHLLPLDLVETLYTTGTSLPLVTSTGYRMLSTVNQYDTLPPIQTLPQPTESVLILALLDALQGLPSVWIRPILGGSDDTFNILSLDWNTICTGTLMGTLLESIQFELINHPAFTPASASSRAAVAAPLAALIDRILPLARSVIRCTWYVERRYRTGGGLTVQALTSAVRALLQEFTHLLVRLEALVLYPKPGTPSLSIQELWYYLQSSVHTMQALDTILYTAPNAIGGELLNSITHFITSSGDETVRTLATFLLEKASAPLLTWLENWIFNGTLTDAYHEFFIREHPLRLSGTIVDWDNQFTIDTTMVPIFLLPHTNTILLSGKYLYVLRLCRSKADSVHLYGTFMNKVTNVTKHTLGPLQTNVRTINDKVPKRVVGPFSPSVARYQGTGFRTSPGTKDGTSTGSNLPTVLSPSKTSTVIGADVHIGRELAPSETISVLDSVFNSRRQSVASTVMTTDTSHIPAAGLPSVNVSSSNALYGVNTDRILTEASEERKQKSPSSASSVITGSPNPRGITDSSSVLTVTNNATTNGSILPPIDPGAPLSEWLQAALSTKIQSIGKSLCPAATKLLFSLDPQVYATHIQNAYAYSSRALLEYLYTVPDTRSPPTVIVPPGTVKAFELTGGDLLGRLSTLKTFFLMAQGDWVIHFFDLVDEELQKDVLSNTLPNNNNTINNNNGTGTGLTVSVERLRNCLDMALRSSSSIASDDPYRQAISVTLAPSSLLAHLDHLLSNGQKPLPTAIKGLKGFNVFCLDFQVPWPASLILSPSVLTKYQILFRHLFFLRYVERSIALSWTSHQGCKELGTNIRMLLSVSYALRQRMLHFLQNMTYFVTVEVIEPRWHEFVLALRSSSTVDDVLQAHAQFLENTIAASLLTSPDLLKLLTKLVTLCLLFSEQMTKAIEDHRLTEDELDAKVGLNRAGERARSQRERGVYFTADDEDKSGTNETGAMIGIGIGKRAGGVKKRSNATTTMNEETNETLSDRERRQERIQIQTDTMLHHMSQAGWQNMIDKSSKIFETLLNEFMSALHNRANRAPDTSTTMPSYHIAYLLERLDWNGFYSKHLTALGKK